MLARVNQKVNVVGHKNKCMQIDLIVGAGIINMLTEFPSPRVVCQQWLATKAGKMPGHPDAETQRHIGSVYVFALSADQTRFLSNG